MPTPALLSLCTAFGLSLCPSHTFLYLVTLTQTDFCNFSLIPHFSPGRLVLGLERKQTFKPFRNNHSGCPAFIHPLRRGILQRTTSCQLPSHPQIPLSLSTVNTAVASLLPHQCSWFLKELFGGSAHICLFRTCHGTQGIPIVPTSQRATELRRRNEDFPSHTTLSASDSQPAASLSFVHFRRIKQARSLKVSLVFCCVYPPHYLGMHARAHTSPIRHFHICQYDPLRLTEAHPGPRRPRSPST